MKNCRGFTLLEVLVAIAFLAIAFSAVSRVYGDNINTVVHLKEKTLAHWVAQNIAEQAAFEETLPADGTRSGTLQMANIDWYWRQQIMATDDADVRRLLIEVSNRKDARPIASIQTFLGIPHEKTR